MSQKKATVFQMNVLLYFLMQTSFIGITMTNVLRVARQDSWISVIIGAILGFIPLLLYFYIINYRKEDSIIELNEHLFGKVLGKIINTALILFVVFFAVITFWNLTNFISSQYLFRTPTFAIAILFLFPIIYLLSKGRAVINRSSVILFFFCLLFILGGVFGLFSQIDFTKLQPILGKGIPNVLRGSIYYITYSILPIFLLTIIPRSQIANNKNYEKKTIQFYLAVNLILFTILFFTISILGDNLSTLYQYPTFHLLKRVSLAGFITRVESTLSIQWLLNLFVEVVFALYFILHGLKRTFRIKKPIIDFFIYLVLIVILLWSNQVLFSSNTVGNEFTYRYYCYIVYFFLFIIPVIIAIQIFFRQKNNSSK